MVLFFLTFNNQCTLIAKKKGGNPTHAKQAPQWEQ